MSYKRLFEYLFLKVSLRFRPWKLQHGNTLDVCNRTLMVSQKVHNSGHSSNDRLSDFLRGQYSLLVEEYKRSGHILPESSCPLGSDASLRKEVLSI